MKYNIDPKIIESFLMNYLDSPVIISDNEIRSYCPNPSHDDSSHPNFYFNTLKQVGVCHSKCGGCGLDQVLDYLNCTVDDIKSGTISIEQDDIVIDMDDDDEYISDRISYLERVIFNELDKIDSNDKIVIKYDQSLYEHTFRSKEYLQERGFLDVYRVIEEFNIGFDEYHKYPSLVFPCMINNECRYIQRRHINYGIRYINMKKVKRENVIWGLDHCDKKKDYVIVCEGPITALTWLYLGYNAIALLGTSITRYQMNLLHNFTKIINFDLDEKGDICYNNIKYICQNRRIMDFRFNKNYDANDYLAVGKEELLISKFDKLLIF